jgi:hypothetical protein
MRLSWLTGTLTEHEYRHHHPLEYEQLRKDPKAIVPPEKPKGGRPGA